MKYQLLLLCWCVFWIEGYAQESDKPLKTNKQWEMGISLWRMWDGNGAGTLSFRKHFTKNERRMAHGYGLSMNKRYSPKSTSINTTIFWVNSGFTQKGKKF